MTHQVPHILPEKLSRFDVWLLVEDGDTEIHEGLGKVNHLLPAEKENRMIMNLIGKNSIFRVSRDC